MSFKVSKNFAVSLFVSILFLNLTPICVLANATKSSKSKSKTSSVKQAKNNSKARYRDQLLNINTNQASALNKCSEAINFPNELIASDLISALAEEVVGWNLSKANFDKGEFETSAEFEKRLDTLGLFVGGNETMVFKIPVSSEFKIYDADSETMSVSLPVASGTDASLAGGGYSDKAFSIGHLEKAGKTIAGKTAMGIKFNYTIYYERSSFVVLDSESIKSFSFASKEVAQKPMQNDAFEKSMTIEEVTSKGAMELTNLKPVSNYHGDETVLLKMPRDKAIRLSNNMYLLLIGSWRKPFYNSQDFEDRASLDNPYYTFSNIETFYVKSKCAFLVDKQNGEILHTYQQD